MKEGYIIPDDEMIKLRFQFETEMHRSAPILFKDPGDWETFYKKHKRPIKCLVG